jgi:hypothetical protein
MEPVEVAKITRSPYYVESRFSLRVNRTSFTVLRFQRMQYAHCVREFERLHSTRALLQMTVISPLLDPTHLF